MVAENDVDRSRLQLLKVIGLRLDNPLELTGSAGYIPDGESWMPRRRWPRRASIAPS